MLSSMLGVLCQCNCRGVELVAEGGGWSALSLACAAAELPWLAGVQLILIAASVSLAVVRIVNARAVRSVVCV